MPQPVRRFWTKVGWAGAILTMSVGLAFLWKPAAPAPSPTAPDPVSPPELPALDLPEIQPLEVPAPELSWTAPLTSATGWGALQVDSPPEDLPSLATVGGEQFTALCVACHGSGAGDGPLAPDLPRAPRNLREGLLRTRSQHGPPSPEEVFRTLTVGAPAFGMPAFAHLSPDDRWALTSYVLSLRETPAAPAPPSELPARPPPDEIDLRLGQALYRSSCVPCHGPLGAGDGPLAPTLRDDDGLLCPPTRLSQGPSAYRGGARAEDVARILVLGRPGTPMLPFRFEPRELWSLAAYVARLSELGFAQRRQAWNEFFRARRALAEEPDSDPRPPLARWATATKGLRSQAGCLGCHEGIEQIADGPMRSAILAFAGGDEARACTICHEGQATAETQDGAHAGLIGNPGSLWVTSLGLGCGKCHSDRGALTSLLGLPFPEALGGSLLQVTSRQSDPSGASGSNHAYRMQRALMAQETGKVYLLTASVGLVERGAPRYTDFPLDDPDGPEPCAGSPAYRELIARGLEQGHLQRLERTEGLPTFLEALELTGDAARAGYVDYFRKDCARCHLWGEGKTARGEARSSGCSACHVLYGFRSFTESEDRTIPRQTPGHPRRHRLELAPPEEQCNHCHTRGMETRHSEAHQLAGLGCADCHTSIDVHGDGNIYPSIEHQLEVACEDCHGSPEAPPWELPLGYASPLAEATPRGVWGEAQHLLTSRGNPRTNWRRDGDRVVVRSFYSDRELVVPLLRDAPAAEQASPHGHDVAGHAQLSCAACHGSTSPSCTRCHMTYNRLGEAQDWLLSALAYDPRTTRQRQVFTPGATDVTVPTQASVWLDPEMRLSRSQKLTPKVPGCEVFFRYVGEDGQSSRFRPFMNPGGADYPPPVAPTLAHEKALPARSCEECHPDGPEAPLRLPGSAPR